MRFEYPYLFVLLILLIPLAVLLFRRKKGTQNIFSPEALGLLLHAKHTLPPWLRHAFLLAALALFIAALARPEVDNGEIKVRNSTIDIIAAFDLSRSMFANDVFPNRLALAKLKFDTFLSDVKSARVGAIGFSERAFLVSPLTEDFSTLSYLVDNMNTNSISLHGTDIMEALKQTDSLMGTSDKKAMLLFTDGGDKETFGKEIAYAKSHNIVVFVYNIGTEKGGVIPTDHGALTDGKGNIVIVRRNDAVKTLALQSGGAYMNAQMQRNDIKGLADAIKARFSSKREKADVIRDVKPLFLWPLGAGIILLMLSLYSLPQRRRRHA